MEKCRVKSQPGLSVRGDAEWLQWVCRAAASEQRSCSSFVERLLVEWARANGFPDPPPRHGTKRAEVN